VSGLSVADFLTHDFVESSYEVASQELRAKNPFRVTFVLISTFFDDVKRFIIGSAQEPVGGSLYSVKRHGKSAAEIGLRVLSGESPGAIPIRESQDSAYMFDWRALKRWGLRESDLPSGSTVLF
jgi:hypothetical protein